MSMLALAQQPPPKKAPPPAQDQKEQEPPEEDESLKPKEYALNPLESQRNVTTGDFYFKRGKFQAALYRYTEATKWDPGSAVAFFKLGEVDEKLHDAKGAKDAYQKCIDAAGDAKTVEEAHKRLAKLK
jgi:tetratricopeptide (TPR) repeat protein